MLYHFQRKKLYRHLLVGGALCAAGLGVFSCSDRYSLDEDQPSGLSNIYGYMQSAGNYTNYLHLIDDLGQKEVLARTGSRTMFIANDDAFDDFFASNSWGVHGYDELSMAQKALLLNSSMLENPNTSTLLSSAQASGNGRPVKGEVCRRNTSLTLVDSVSLVSRTDAESLFPDNPYFKGLYHEKRDTVVLFPDAATPAPLLHFTGMFVTTNKLYTSDIDFIYNQGGGFTTNDIYVNESKVTEPNIFCKNGFIHKVDKVITPLDNMAEIIRKNPQMSEYNKLLERFAVPMPVSDALRKSYWKNVRGVEDGSGDTVFVKRFFSDRSQGSTNEDDVALKADKNGSIFGPYLLKYDPAWNGYVPSAASPRNLMMEDLAVMLVPTNTALEDWWQNGVGKDIRDFYGEDRANAPTSTLVDLLRNHQLTDFCGSVPSRFDALLNDDGEEMKIQPGDVEQVYLGCNGLVFLTNKVFSPTTYSSVLYPAAVDTVRFSIMRNLIEQMQYKYYLNSMVSKFVFLLPTNQAFNGTHSERDKSTGEVTTFPSDNRLYVDPASYNRVHPSVWEFSIDPKTFELRADIYEGTKTEDGGIRKTGVIRKKRIEGGVSGNAILRDRVEDMLDNLIVIEEFRPEKHYYQTKGRTFVRIDKAGADTYKSYGSFHYNLNPREPLPQDNITYPKRNGITIPVNEIPMGTPNSVAATLHNTVVPGIDSQNDSIFKEFYRVVEACALKKINSKDKWHAGDQTYGNVIDVKQKGTIGTEDLKSGDYKASYLLNNYHYTIYAPTNDAMALAYAAGLPTPEALEAAVIFDEENGYNTGSGRMKSRADSLREVMLDFVKYHIQDNSIFVDVDTAGNFETAKTELTLASSTGTKKAYIPGRPYKLGVRVSGGEMTVTDCRNGYDKNTRQPIKGVTAHVFTTEGAFNLMARDYWFDGTEVVSDANANANGDGPSTTTINNSSFAVIHAIDKPLFFAPGGTYDIKGHAVPTQFVYEYKPLSTSSE